MKTQSMVEVIASDGALRKLVRHFYREALQAGYRLTDVTIGGESAAVSTAVKTCMSVGSGQVILEFQDAGKAKKESVLISCTKGEGAGRISYLGAEKSFLNVVADVESYVRQTELHHDMNRKTH